ncbi:hypothetical protein GE061_004221 [Apolygus lucorum]|uniref:Exosome complex component RRP40 n=1 Tax=Apolygus lucorum TaxID=248454 RepID=A0A8S9X171_APOLU|nr:hypothetical protein GE061_004221 [Apolygus lucorum]
MTKQKSNPKEVEEITTCKVGEIVLPGQIVDAVGVKEANKKNQVIVGPGLRKIGDRIVASKCGVLREMNGKIFWVDALGKRYLPARGEGVVGIVTKKMGDYFKVDVRAADAALLHFLAFEGATKKNRPEVNVGDVVYGKMVVESTDMEPELVCINDEGRKTNMGVLSGGFVFRASLHLVRKILQRDCPLLPSLGSAFNYESAIGMNGVIWVKSQDPVSTIAVSNAILSAETMTPEELTTFCANLR